MQILIASSPLRLVLAAFLAIALGLNASAASAQTYGFDNIGTDPAATQGQRCFLSVIDSGGVYSRMVTAWTAPASGSSSLVYTYSMNTFRAVVGSLPASAPHPSTNMNWALYVYDSFEAFRADANQNWRALYTFNFGSPSITYASAPGCMYVAGASGFPAPCYNLSLNLAAPSSVLYRTAAGQPTTNPLVLNGGDRYWFSLVGFNAAASLGVPCVVRTNATVAGQRSPAPSPSISFPMANEQQCNEAGLPYPCNFQLAHNDFYKFLDAALQCDQYRTPVNWIDSEFAPQLNPSLDGTLPRTCGGATQPPCCERTFAGKIAYALTATRHSRKILSTSAVLERRLVDRPFPTCDLNRC